MSEVSITVYPLHENKRPIGFAPWPEPEPEAVPKPGPKPKKRKKKSKK